MATATRVRRAIQRAALVPISFEPTEGANSGTRSWFRVWFQAGKGDQPYIDSDIIRAANPVEARCRVESYEREIARMLGSKSLCGPDSIHATSVDCFDGPPGMRSTYAESPHDRRTHAEVAVHRGPDRRRAA